MTRSTGLTGVLLSLATGAAACASASLRDGDDPVDARPSTDAGPQPDGPGLDAPPADAAPIAVTLTQTTAATVTATNSIACGNNADNTTAENSWYRIFRLAEANITGGLTVTAVTFGVQEATGQPAVQVRVGTYAGALTPQPSQLDTSLITPLASATFMVPNTASTATTTVTVPIAANVPALSQMIVEVFVPDQVGTGKYFYLGGNASGESKPSYLRAPGCDTPQPRTTAALGFPNSHLVIAVSGTH